MSEQSEAEENFGTLVLVLGLGLGLDSLMVRWCTISLMDGDDKMVHHLIDGWI